MNTHLSQLQERIQPVTARWQAMPERDRLALSLLAGFLALVLLYLLMWRPVSQNLQQARDFLQQERTLNAYMKANAPQIQTGTDIVQATVEPAQLQGVVTGSAASAGVSVERLDSQGDGALQVALQPLEFPRLLSWLTSLEAQGVGVDEASLERVEQGRVGSSLLLRAR